MDRITGVQDIDQAFGMDLVIVLRPGTAAGLPAQRHVVPVFGVVLAALAEGKAGREYVDAFVLDLRQIEAEMRAGTAVVVGDQFMIGDRRQRTVAAASGFGHDFIEFPRFHRIFFAVDLIDEDHIRSSRTVIRLDEGPDEVTGCPDQRILVRLLRGDVLLNIIGKDIEFIKTAARELRIDRPQLIQILTVVQILFRNIDLIFVRVVIGIRNACINTVCFVTERNARCRRYLSVMLFQRIVPGIQQTVELISPGEPGTELVADGTETAPAEEFLYIPEVRVIAFGDCESLFAGRTDDHRAGRT